MFAIDEIVPVPLTVFGGAVTEMAPEDLPEGASPFNQDVDFLPGSVFSRAGRQSVYAFSGLSIENLSGFAQTLPGAFAPNEVPWTTPLNATVNTPGTYALVTLNSASLPNVAPVQFADSSGAANADALGTVTPTGPNQILFLSGFALSALTYIPSATQFGGASFRNQILAIPNATALSFTFTARL